MHVGGSLVEEEKLAHDVYVALSEIYDANQLRNIPAAELQHQDAVRVLLDRYGLDDPTIGAAAGEFADVTPDLRSVARQVGVDLWTLDSLWWHSLQETDDPPQPETDEEVGAAEGTVTVFVP